MPDPLSILCIASYYKGQAFLREAKRQGARVYLVTSESLRDADWPRESLDDIFFVHDDDKKVTWRAKTQPPTDFIIGVNLCQQELFALMPTKLQSPEPEPVTSANE